MAIRGHRSAASLPCEPTDSIDTISRVIPSPAAAGRGTSQMQVAHLPAGKRALHCICEVLRRASPVSAQDDNLESALPIYRPSSKRDAKHKQAPSLPCGVNAPLRVLHQVASFSRHPVGVAAFPFYVAANG